MDASAWSRPAAEVGAHVLRADGRGAPLTELNEEAMRRAWETNVLGAILVARASARYFVERERGSIVDVGSTARRSGYLRGTGTAYASSKFALKGMSACWRAELHSSCVRVIHLDASEVQTAFGRRDREVRPTNPTKLRPREIAHAIVSALEMDDRGFIPEMTICATNPGEGWARHGRP